MKGLNIKCKKRECMVVRRKEEIICKLLTGDTKNHTSTTI